MARSLNRALGYRQELKKNYIINGAMMVSQENGTTALTATVQYPVDQFFLSFSNGGTISYAQVASVTPAGSPNRLRVTVTAADAAVAAGDFLYIGQPIEGLRVADLMFGTASAKTITLRFGVKGPAGTYCVEILNSALNRSYVAEYTISGGEANTDVYKTVTIAGDQSGTWLKDIGVGFYLRFSLMCGSTFQQAAGSWGTVNTLGSANQFNFMGTNGNVFELYDVGLYEGTVAPDFQVPDYVSELALCMRYWESTFPLGTQPASAGGVGGYLAATVVSASANGNMLGWEFKVFKRTAPTCTSYNPFAAGSGISQNGAGNFSVIEYSKSASRVVYRESTGGMTVGSSMSIHAKADARM